MVIIPAVDIKSGKCVRLTQGKPDTAVVYQDDPIKAALHWQEEGASYLHIVDLDGAFSGKTANFDLIKKILAAIRIPAEIGGGIRTIDDIKKYIDTGADRVILGTKAVEKTDFLKEAVDRFGDRIAVAIDASCGKAVVQGWVKATDTSILDLAHGAENAGVKTIIYTDTKVDGTLKGADFEGILDFIKNVNMNIILSGGITTIKDIEKIKTLEPEGVTGIIVGKALYTGKLRPEELWTG